MKTGPIHDNRQRGTASVYNVNMVLAGPQVDFQGGMQHTSIEQAARHSGAHTTHERSIAFCLHHGHTSAQLESTQ